VYLRHTTKRRGGKSLTYWHLVRSVRQGRRVRQEVVATLGRLDARGRVKAKALADWITGRRCEPTLFEPRESEPEASVPVDLKKVSIERSRRFGDFFLGLALWCSLQLDQVFDRLLPEGREDVPWSTLAAIHVLMRLCSPSSDLAIAEDLYRKTALEDLLLVPFEKVNDDRIYRALDRMLPHKAALERHLRARLGELFAIEYDLLLYDVTSTYFEGMAKGNPQAQRGYSRDHHRPDCKQVCIALVVTREGIPLAYEVFAGNRVDVTTVEEIVTTIEQRFGRSDRIWVMDRGMVSEKNIAWLEAGGRRYLIGASKAELRRFEQRLVEEKDWKRIREDVEVKVCPGEGQGETFVGDRRLLPAAHQRLELDRGGAVANLHPAHRRGGRVSRAEGPALHPTGLAPAGRPGPGAHLRLLPRLRAVEDARAVAAARLTRQQPAHAARRARPDPQRRCRAANHRRSRAARALRHQARAQPRAPARTARARTAATAADLEAGRDHGHHADVVTTFRLQST
jgi:hypothetical protein